MGETERMALRNRSGSESSMAGATLGCGSFGSSRRDSYRDSRRNSVHKCPETAPRGRFRRSVYTPASPRLSATAQQPNSVHKCPKMAPRGHSSQFVYTLALSPAPATRCHRVAGRSCTRRHRVARKSVYAQLSGNVVPLDAIEWHDHRALGDSEWHNRASQNRRQPERLVVAPWLTGGGVRSAGGSGASA